MSAAINNNRWRAAVSHDTGRVPFSAGKRLIFWLVFFQRDFVYGRYGSDPERCRRRYVFLSYFSSLPQHPRIPLYRICLNSQSPVVSDIVYLCSALRRSDENLNYYCGNTKIPVTDKLSCVDSRPFPGHFT